MTLLARYGDILHLTKLANRYGATRLENACDRVLDLSSVPTIRNISALCKAASERKPETADSGEHQDNRYGITRGASYYSRGGKHNA